MVILFSYWLFIDYFCLLTMLKFDRQTVLIGNVNIERKVKEIIDKKSQKEEEREKKWEEKGEKGKSED